MIIGIDVGGTNTDAVLLQQNAVLSKIKTATVPHNLVSSVTTALDSLLEGRSVKDIERVVLSTTLSTNAIVQDRLEGAAMIVSAGPGVDPHHYRIGPDYRVTKGSIDHRGRECEKLDLYDIDNIVLDLGRLEKRALGVVSKFSVRNPSHETAISRRAEKSFDYIALGHLMAGTLNFPRRIATTYLNASTHHLHRSFVNAIAAAFKEREITAPLFILKADGGTMPLEYSRNFSAFTICSGPAASIMGLMALVSEERFIGLDIGGTTTDISLFHRGVPLFKPYGITIGSHRTLIRGLLARSVPLGGDSELSVKEGKITVGPLRKGAAKAFGGDIPTLTDALITLGGKDEKHLPAARQAMEELAAIRGVSAQEAALESVERAADIIKREVESLLAEVNSRPVYTIREMLEGESVSPELVVAVGGPSRVMAPWLEKAMSRPVMNPPHSEVANALGASLARVTAELTVHADTEEGWLFVVEQGFRQMIKSSFSLDDVKKLAVERIKSQSSSLMSDGDQYEFTEEQEFAMVRGFSTTGRNMRVRIQSRPGLTGSLRQEGVTC